MYQQVITKGSSVKLSKAQKQSDQVRVSKYYRLFFCLYFLQGLILSVGITMPYLYAELPSYKTLSLFNTIDLPFSFKFIVSPFLQKYTNFSYGKRKTWIVASQFMCFVFLFMASFFTQFTMASFLALILMITEFVVIVQDISLDSLSIKQIRCPQKTSIVQSVAQNFGKVAGSLILLKFTSLQFASKVGLSEAITNPAVMISCLAIFLVATSTSMHFFFKQTSLECQSRGKQKNICEIISYSTTFFDMKSKYCRFAIFLLLNSPGLNFYEAGYDYEMIKAGFSRDDSNTASNIISVIVLFLSFKITPLINTHGPTKCLKIVFFSLSSVYLFNVIVFSQSIYLFMCTEFLSQLLNATINMTIYMYIYTFPIHGFTGMFATLMLSIWNFSQITPINTLIINYFGWRKCAFFGIIVQYIFLFQLEKFINWIDQGSLQLDQTISGSYEDYQKVYLADQIKSSNSQSMFESIEA